MKTITIDTSILVAILTGESGWEQLEAILSENRVFVSSATILECFMVVRADLGEGSSLILDQLIVEYGIEVVEFTPKHLRHALMAFERFGKGRHPARLNFGDCIVYSTAKFSGTPLLFLGNDFKKTDLEIVEIGGQ